MCRIVKIMKVEPGTNISVAIASAIKIAAYYLGLAGAAKLTHRERLRFWYTRAVLARVNALEKLPVSED